MDARAMHTLTAPPPEHTRAHTSAWMLGTEPVKPFSAMAQWELLGELGPEHGALLHTAVTAGGHGDTAAPPAQVLKLGMPSCWRTGGWHRAAMTLSTAQPCARRSPVPS